MTKLDISAFNDKASKDPACLELYESYDYINAYSKHTDMRVRKDPHLAIGGRWEDYGKLQFEFLKLQELDPESVFLDIGCGTGRLSRHIVPYLNYGNYIGVDISPEALEYARVLAIKEGWGNNGPTFILTNGTLSLLSQATFDIAWAHSVFTHLPAIHIEAVFSDLKQMFVSQFWFTYKHADKPQRSGLKQFQYPFSFFFELGEQYGFYVESYDLRWSGINQRLALAIPIS